MALFPGKETQMHEPPASVQGAPAIVTPVVSGEGANNAPRTVDDLPHYADNSIQPIEFMKAQMPAAAFRGFLHGNVLKYIARADKKNGVEDLKKAQVYLGWLIEFDTSGKITVSGKQV